MQVTDRHENVMPIGTNAELDAAIEELEKKKEMQQVVMSGTFDDIKTNLQPKNLLKSAVHKITHSEDALSIGLKLGGTVAAAFVTKKLIDKNKSKKRKEHEEYKEQIREQEPGILGTVAKSALTSVAINSIPTVKAWISSAWENLFTDSETKIIHFKKVKHD